MFNFEYLNILLFAMAFGFGLGGAEGAAFGIAAVTGTFGIVAYIKKVNDWVDRND